MRYENIEYRTTSCLGKEGTYEEIVCWYKNPQYGTEKRLKKEGWTFDKDGDAHLDNCHIHHGMFKTKELCYTVAFVEWNNAHDEFDVRSVGKRAFELEGKDRENFMMILDKISEEIQ